MREDYLTGEDSHMSATEKDIDRALRPLSFRDFAGQDKVVENLKIFVQAARRRGEALDHVLLHGPPGLGKTTLSHIIASELDANIKMTSGPVGLSTIATACGEESETIEEVYEPFLIQEGYIKRTARGREATELAYVHLGKIPPQRIGSLFDPTV